MKHRMQKVLTRRNKQAGITGIQIAVSIAVVAISVAGGLFLFKYIGEQKVKNETAEISDLKTSSVAYASQHGGRYTTLDLSQACSKGFFPDGRCSGTGASTTATNQWGGSITFAAVNLTGPNTGAKWTYPGYSNRNCISEITDLWNHAARIDVGSTGVKTATTQQIDDSAIIAACDASGDNATIAYTFGPN